MLDIIMDERDIVSLIDAVFLACFAFQWMEYPRNPYDGD